MSVQNYWNNKRSRLNYNGCRI